VVGGLVGGVVAVVVEGIGEVAVGPFPVLDVPPVLVVVPLPEWVGSTLPGGLVAPALDVDPVVPAVPSVPVAG
jgi:hypothetical protein